MLTKLDTGSTELDPSAAEQLADLLFEIGSHQAEKCVHTSAVWWLEKAHDLLATQSQEQLSSDAGDLEFSIKHRMVKALMNVGGEESNKRAGNIVSDLEIESGDRLAVLLLKLDLFDSDPTFSPQEYCDVLQRIIRLVHLTDSNVKTVLYHVHKLRLRESRLAHTLLSMLITDRLLGADDAAWLEKALITVVWNCTTSADLNDALELLSTVIDTVAVDQLRPLSPSTTHAAHIVCETYFNSVPRNSKAEP